MLHADTKTKTNTHTVLELPPAARKPSSIAWCRANILIILLSFNNNRYGRSAFLSLFYNYSFGFARLVPV